LESLYDGVSEEPNPELGSKEIGSVLPSHELEGDDGLDPEPKSAEPRAVESLTHASSDDDQSAVPYDGADHELENDDGLNPGLTE